MRLRVLASAFACFWQCAPGAFADEPAKASSAKTEAETRAEMLMIGMRDARDRLRQGVVRAIGRQFVPSRRAAPINSDVTLTLAFDWDTDVWRCDSDDVRPVVDSDAGGNFDPGAAHRERFRTDCIYTPQQRTAYTQVGDANPAPISIIAAD